MEAFKKIVRLGKTPEGWNIFCKIEYKDSALSISGVEGPMKNGNAKGSWGQIEMLYDNLAIAQITRDSGLSLCMLTQFFQYWRDYHLNNMQAGSPAQTAWLKAYEEEYEKARAISYYEWATKCLHVAGLNPDPNYLYKGEPYKYGHAWLGIQVPENVLHWLKTLPDTDITPVWV